MNSSLSNPAFVAYAITCLILGVNVLFLWWYSGFVRYMPTPRRASALSLCRV